MRCNLVARWLPRAARRNFVDQRHNPRQSGGPCQHGTPGLGRVRRNDGAVRRNSGLGGAQPCVVGSVPGCGANAATTCRAGTTEAGTGDRRTARTHLPLFSLRNSSGAGATYGLRAWWCKVRWRGGVPTRCLASQLFPRLDGVQSNGRSGAFSAGGVGMNQDQLSTRCLPQEAIEYPCALGIKVGAPELRSPVRVRSTFRELGHIPVMHDAQNIRRFFVDGAGSRTGCQSVRKVRTQHVFVILTESSRIQTGDEA